jgi:thymidylate synthase (FAD)
MKIVEPSYEIISCPDGEECLAFLERVCRTAYKSEDKIDNGKEICPDCQTSGKRAEFYKGSCPDCQTSGKRAEFYKGRTLEGDCPTCQGKGRVQVREPSSHKLIRTILKTGRREALSDRVAELMKINFEQPGNTWQRPEELARDVVDFILNTVRDDPPHESVIEHESITVLFTSNRGFTHELVRHRLAAFTQESTRYCNYSKGKFGKEIAVTRREAEHLQGSRADEWPINQAIGRWMHRLEQAEENYMRQLEDGSAPQIARDLLPQVLKADIVITANLREWRHIFRLRCSPRAHPDMRQLMIPLRDELRKRIPIIFEDT